MSAATAVAHPNIAFIKYWGNREPRLRIPANGSISMNLDGLYTRTRVRFDASLAADRLLLNGKAVTGTPLQRVQVVLDRVRELAGHRLHAEVVSENNFPQGAGIASSASAFAALALAASAAAGLSLDEAAISRLARRGSGSACRSIPAGFVEWQAGTGDADSYAHSIAPPEHWALADCIAVVDDAHKEVGSTRGHELA
ncbi:MAG: diphosphomevalonate decarboxylase, partial [Anaerolineae bacterium]